MSFYVGDEDLDRIRAEQERCAAMGIRVSKSAAIRSLIFRASETAPKSAAAAAPAEKTFNREISDPVQFRQKGKIFKV